MSLNSYDAESFINYLGVDYERAGSLYRIVCPFHADSHPSLVIYPELDRGACCFACGETCSWAYLATVIKGIDYKQALEDLGQESLPPAERKAQIKVQPMAFCSPQKPAYIKAFTEKHNQCMPVSECKEGTAIRLWLERKKLWEVAQELDWRIHKGDVFRHWGIGLLIPYKVNGEVLYERFREFNPETKKLEKPKGPFDVGIQPYTTTFRPNSTVFVCEGECLTPETEVLTKSGWVRFDEYDGQSEVAQWDNGEITYVKPQAFLVKEHKNGRIYHYQSRGVSFATTPKHRICGFRGEWENMHIVVDKAEVLYQKKTDRKLPRVGDADGEGLPLTDDQIRLAVAVSADFSERKYSWYCNLSKSRKKERLERLLEKAGVKFAAYKKDSRGMYGWQIWEKPWYLSKEFDHTWLAKMSLHQKEVMLDEIKYWDGNSVAGRNQAQYSTVVYRNAVFVQTLAHLAGVTATIVKRERDTNFKQGFEWFVVNILFSKKYSSLQNYWSHTTIERYTGKVYCVSVPSTFFLIRHNGHISVTGNTDTASIYAHGGSALGTPGAVAKKAINSIVAFIADRGYIDTVVCCGDRDEAGQKMNSLIAEAVMQMCPRKKLVTYSVESDGEKADLNDDHANGLLKLPVEWTANYGRNYDRQPFADHDFSEFVDELSQDLETAESKGIDPWVKVGNIWVLRGSAFDPNADAETYNQTTEVVEANAGLELVVTRVGNLQPSKYGGEFRYIFFKDPKTGENYKTCIDDKCRNRPHWQEVIDLYESHADLHLTNVYLKGPGLVDADSMPKIVSQKKLDI